MMRSFKNTFSIVYHIKIKLIVVISYIHVLLDHRYALPRSVRINIFVDYLFIKRS